MITIYVVGDWNEDATQITNTVYFLDKEDAVKRSSNKEGKISPWCRLSEISVFEKGEYSPEVIAKQKALGKLTEEERKLLSL